MHKNIRLRLATAVLTLLLLLALSGCGQLEIGFETKTTISTGPKSSATPTPTPPAAALISPTAASTQTATATAFPSPTATATLTPPPAGTLAPTATATSTPAPTATKTAVYLPPTHTATPAPQIYQFEINPQVIGPGGSVTVRWAANGEEAQLCHVTQAGVTLACDAVALSGTRPYTFAVDQEMDTLLELRVFDHDTQATASLLVSVVCPAEEWFFAQPPAGCPGTAVSSNAAAQHFQHGLMIWVEETDDIYVFFENSPSYRTYYDPLQTTDNPPETDDIQPPDGYYAPISGFGMVWRGEAPYADDVRRLLGWALEPEYNFETRFQGNQSTYSPTLYLLSPDDEILALDLTYGNWYIWNP